MYYENYTICTKLFAITTTFESISRALLITPLHSFQFHYTVLLHVATSS